MSSLNTRALLEQQAGDMVSEITQFLQSSLTIPALRLGIVASQQTGPPPTLTITIHGQTVANVRYIGTAPSVGGVVVVLAEGPFYICLGALAT